MGSSIVFLIHKWDLPYAYNQLNFFLFADDTHLLYADKNLRSLEVTVTTEFTSVCNWLMTKKYYLLNTKESSFVTQPYQKQMNFDIAIKLFHHDKNYSREETVLNTLLFSLIQTSLGNNIHILFITSRISKYLEILSRLRHFVPTRHE